MAFFQNNLRTVTSQKNFRPPTDNNLVYELRQREKVYLDVIVDLTNRNRYLEHELKMYQQHCEMLEVELRKRSESSGFSCGSRKLKTTSSEKQLKMDFRNNEQDTRQIDVLKEQKNEVVDEEPELMATNSSRFVERMALVLENNFGEKKYEVSEITANVSLTNTESQKSVDNPGISSLSVDKRTLTPLNLDFSLKNKDLRNIYTSTADTKNFKSALYTNSNNQTSRAREDEYIKIQEDKENTIRANIMVNQSRTKANNFSTISRQTNKSLNHKEYLKMVEGAVHPNSGIHTSSHSNIHSVNANHQYAGPPFRQHPF